MARILFFFKINEKGQLRLSRRALLPESETENATAKQQQTPTETSIPMKENIAPSKRPYIKSKTTPAIWKAPAPLKESNKSRQKKADETAPSEMAASKDWVE